MGRKLGSRQRARKREIYAAPVSFSIIILTLELVPMFRRFASAGNVKLPALASSSGGAL